MSQAITYDGASSLEGVVRPATVRFVEAANLGATGMGALTVDDPGGAIVIGALKELVIEESAATPARSFTGSTTDRVYGRSAVYANIAAARGIEVELIDLNARFGFLEVTGDDGDRPAETVGERIAWLLGSGYLGLADTGWVVYPDAPMSAADYRGQSASNVVADCATTAGFNYFARWDPDSSQAGLAFFDSNTSELLTSTKRISNVDADVDGVDVFAPLDDSKVRLSPEPVRSGMYVPYLRGAVYRTRPATATEFAPRDGTAPSATVDDEVTATALGDRLLLEASTEDSTITCTIWVEPEHENDILAGDRLEVKFSHLPGYEDWTWVRVTQRAVSLPAVSRYQVDLTLAGLWSAPPSSCDDAVDLNAPVGTVTAAVGLESGTTTWAHATIPGWFGSPLDDPVTAIPVLDPTNANDGDVDTQSYCAAQNLRFAGCVGLYWYSDLGSVYSICSHRGTTEFSGDSVASRPPTSIDYSDDFASWTSAEYTLSYTDSLPAPRYWVATLTAPIEARYWRLRYQWCNSTPGIAGLWVSPNAFNSLGTKVYDWQILGDPDPV